MSIVALVYGRPMVIRMGTDASAATESGRKVAAHAMVASADRRVSMIVPRLHASRRRLARLLRDFRMCV